MILSVNDLFAIDKFNDFIKKNLSSEFLTRTNSFYPLKDEIIYLLSCKNYNFLKTALTTQQETDTVLSFDISEGSPSSDNIQDEVNSYCQSNKIDHSFYIFNGSKVAFYNTLGLTVFAPSVIQFVTAAFETIGHIKFVGPGRGSFVLFKPVESFSEHNLSLLVAGRKDFYANSKNTKYINRILEEDCDYYKDMINVLMKSNTVLNEQIQSLEKQNYLNTQMTWR